MKPNPIELHELLSIGIERLPRWNWRHPLRKRYVRFPARAIGVRGETWYAITNEGDAWGYRLRQVRQILEALQPLLDEYRTQQASMIMQMTREMG
jgi:hypothetical protein